MENRLLVFEHLLSSLVLRVADKEWVFVFMRRRHSLALGDLLLHYFD